MNFESANNYLMSLTSFERMPKFVYSEAIFDLNKFKKFLKKYAGDYLKIKTLHIAGSKGKGTTAHILAEYLNKKGYRTGLFTSPHLFEVTERIMINRQKISHEKFAGYVNKLKKVLEEKGGEHFKITYFEALTAIAFKYFLDEKVDYAVFEVGMGGRLDSTNVIKPEVSVLTSVEKEHIGILGKNLREILGEKLGIYKEGVPFVIGAQSSYVDGLIRKKFQKKKKIYFVKDVDFPCRFDLLDRAKEDNSRTAYLALQVMTGRIDKKVFKKIPADLKIPGRFSIRKIRGKDVIFDIAHTKASMRNLIESAQKKFPSRKFVFLISMMKGKEIRKMAEEILAASDRVILTVSHSERGKTPRELRKIFMTAGKKTKNFMPKNLIIIDDCKKAFEQTLGVLEKSRILVVTGSNFLVGKLLT